MWMSGYFEKELNIPVFFESQTYEFNGKKMLVGHGDGLGPGDHGYKFIKKVFRNPICQFLFGLLPPFFGISLANFFSKRSRIMTGTTDEKFLGEEKEWLVLYAKDKLKKEHFDFFVFGHRHLPIDFQLKADSRYINLGDWIKYNSYAEFDGTDIQLKYYQ
jgi:UDP-2,3-diacylglucosamine hydrolase